MKNNRGLRAFSLIEISIVLLIIGILVAGVTQSSRLIAQSKINSAKAMTQSAPVSSIKNLMLWIETTSEASFDDSEEDEGLALTNWYDINPQVSVKSSFAGVTTARPLYKNNIINGLPAVLFDGTNDFMTSANFPNIITGASTVFAVVKLSSAALAAKPIISKRPAAGYATSAPNIQFGTTASGSTGWTYCDTAGVATSGVTCNYSADATVATTGNYVVSVVYTANSTSVASSTAAGISFFQNGATEGQATTTSTPNLSVTTSLFLGKDGTSDTNVFFNGYIGELIIFDRALKKEERQSIEAYLGKKWGISMTVETF